MDLFSFVKNNLSILDVISEFVPLKQIGSYWKGQCPFHSESDASFTVSPDKQIFYCFGCQASGDVIGFFAKIENISQVEAANLLVERSQIELPEEIKKSSFKGGKTLQQKEAYYNIHEHVAQWAHKQLCASKTAQDYLFERGISQEQIKNFYLGYFPGGLSNVNKLIKYLSSYGILAKDLLEYGLLMEGRSCLYSSFEERILFPIKDHIGRFCGFGGRAFKKGDDRAKYYNSRESNGFAKGKLLFGLDLAKKHIQKAEKAFLVEGYMDCIAMVQHGWSNTVATLGTACTVDHLKLLSRYVTSLYLLYDGDKAGQKAILRIAQLCWEVSLDLKVVLLPTKEDPASYLHENKDLNLLIDQRRDIFTFFVDSLCVDFAHEPLANKLALAEKIISVISSVKDHFKQDLLLQQASLQMQLPFDSLRDLLVSYRRKAVKKGVFRFEELGGEKQPVKSGDSSDEAESYLLEEKIFSAIINSVDNEEKLNVEPEVMAYFSSKVSMLLEKLLYVTRQTGVSQGIFTQFLEILDEKDRNWVIKISLRFEAQISKELFGQLVFRFYRHNWKNIVRGIKQDMLKAKLQQDTKKLQEILKRFAKLKQGLSNRGLI